MIETKKTAIAVKTATNAAGIGIGQNNGEAAGQAVHHLHFHVIPRFANDGYIHWTPHTKIEIDPVLAEKIAAEI